MPFWSVPSSSAAPPAEVKPRSAAAKRRRWSAVGREPSASSAGVLKALSFALPLLAWCAISYVPWLWHPLVRVTEVGGSTFLQAGMRMDKQAYADENARLAAAGLPLADGRPANPVFLPAPHDVGRALYTAFTAEPRRGEKRLHESLLHSISIIASGFAIAAVIGVPLGLACGVWPVAARLIEPCIDFVRYMPPPVFGALALAVLGINDEPKIAIIVIGIFFNLILVVANTTRLVDRNLIEAAQTLGCSNRWLVTRVVIPAVLPNLYNDLRILLGVGWCYLTVAEMIGASSGISLFINQQGKYRNYDNVFAGIVVIGLVGLITDQLLAFLGRFLFPWQGRGNGRAATALWRTLIWVPNGAWRLVAGRQTP